MMDEEEGVPIPDLPQCGGLGIQALQILDNIHSDQPAYPLVIGVDSQDDRVQTQTLLHRRNVRKLGETPDQHCVGRMTVLEKLESLSDKLPGDLGSLLSIP